MKHQLKALNIIEEGCFGMQHADCEAGNDLLKVDAATVEAGQVALHVVERLDAKEPSLDPRGPGETLQVPAAPLAELEDPLPRMEILTLPPD